MIAIDIEAWDPNLHKLGPGCNRHDGYIYCVGTYDGKNAKAYIPGASDWQELVDRLSSGEEVVFHNGVYDTSWLCVGYNLKIKGRINDTMTRACFIDEYATHNLDDCCKRMGLKGKNKDDTIKAWYAKSIGKDISKVSDAYLWAHSEEIWNDKTGRELMIKYNLQDCIATYNLYYAQEPYMANYQRGYDIECRLYPVIIEMRKNGVAIDEDKLEALRHQLHKEKDEVEKELLYKFDITPDIITSPKKFGIKMHSLGIESPMLTAKGAESWNSLALDRLSDKDVIRTIQHWKNINAALVKYVEGNLRDCIWQGRIYGTFSPNKSDEGGTITGRFSASSPNLQNISAREKKHGFNSYGAEMRDLFIPDEGCLMFACDYSQIEYLLLAHYAYGPQAESFRADARAGIDFHTSVMNNIGFPERQIVKTLNYGKMYGMGIQKMKMLNYVMFTSIAEKKGMDIDSFCEWLNNEYNTKMPVIRDTMQHIQTMAKMQGYVESIGNRYHHKPKVQFDPETGRWNDGIYKMTNYLIQGSASDILKKALVDTYEQGIFDYIKFHITVHDENVCSVPPTKEGVQAAAAMEDCMNNSYKEQLLIPLKAVGGIGTSWNSKHAEEDWQALREKFGLKRSGEHTK